MPARLKLDYQSEMVALNEGDSRDNCRTFQPDSPIIIGRLYYSNNEAVPSIVSVHMGDTECGTDNSVCEPSVFIQNPVEIVWECVDAKSKITDRILIEPAPKHFPENQRLSYLRFRYFGTAEMTCKNNLCVEKKKNFGRPAAYRWRVVSGPPFVRLYPFGQDFYILTQNPGEYVVEVEATFRSLIPCTCELKDVQEMTGYLYRLKILTPSGDPVSSPASSGTGQNEYTFTSDRPVGKLPMKLVAGVTPPTAASKIAPFCRFAVDPVPGSPIVWGRNVPNGKPVVDGNKLVATLHYNGLPPESTAFGLKHAKLYNRGLVADSAKFEVFFPKDAANHPGGQVGAPNWYHYWSQTPANLAKVPGMTYHAQWRSEFQTFDTHGRPRGIYIGTDASRFGIDIWGRPKGIDCFAWTTGHEAKHHKQLTAWWPAPDAPRNYIDIDPDIDRIPSSVEPDYMPGRPYNPNSYRSYPDTIRYSSGRQATIRDTEDICMRSQVFPYRLDLLWKNGDSDSKDWANPGKNSKNVY